MNGFPSADEKSDWGSENKHFGEKNKNSLKKYLKKI